MEAKELLLDLIGAKLRRDRGLRLVRDEFKGKRPDGVIKSGDTVMGIVLCLFDESQGEIERKVKEFLGLDTTVYLLLQKGRRKEVTDMLWRSSLLNRVKIITWDVQIGF